MITYEQNAYRKTTSTQQRIRKIKKKNYSCLKYDIYVIIQNMDGATANETRKNGFTLIFLMKFQAALIFWNKGHKDEKIIIKKLDL